MRACRTIARPTPAPPAPPTISTPPAPIPIGPTTFHPTQPTRIARQAQLRHTQTPRNPHTTTPLNPRNSVPTTNHPANRITRADTKAAMKAVTPEPPASRRIQPLPLYITPSGVRLSTTRATVHSRRTRVSTQPTRHIQSSMEFRQLGYSGLQIPVLSFGTGTF